MTHSDPFRSIGRSGPFRGPLGSFQSVPHGGRLSEMFRSALLSSVLRSGSGNELYAQPGTNGTRNGMPLPPLCVDAVISKVMSLIVVKVPLHGRFVKGAPVLERPSAHGKLGREC